MYLIDGDQITIERVASARGAATREHLLAVATALFAERGYEATSIKAVLQESGVSRGSHGLGVIKAALAAIAAQGGRAPGLVEVFAHVVLVAIDEVLSRLLARPG
jgi:hypothetical protein